MQVPIISGIYTSGPEFRTAYPVNMVPVPKDTGINAGYLRPAEGIATFCDVSAYGIDRGGIVWDGVHYRVCGQTLVSIDSDGVVSAIGSGITGESPVRMVYSFDRLAIAGGGALWYLKAGELSRVSDDDLGTVLDVLWVDGYFLTTDGTYLIQTELTDPAAVDPLKYGSSEANPDRIVCLRKIRREVYAINRYTTEVFQNIGGSGFAFQAIPGAQIERGCVGVNAACVFDDAIAFAGGGVGESTGIYIAANGQSAKISTSEIDTILSGLTDSEQASIVLEQRTAKGHNFLLVHLPGQSLVYDVAASKALQMSAWHVLSSASAGVGVYRFRHAVLHNGLTIGGDPSQARIGALTDSVMSHYGEPIGWSVSTQVLFNEARSAIVHSIDLQCLTGYGVTLGMDPTIWASYSHDGLTWSQERPISAGKTGDTTKRIQWRGCGQIRQRRIQRFSGTSDARIAVARLDMTLEPLNV
jgi:hypothetical protein